MWSEQLNWDPSIIQISVCDWKETSRNYKLSSAREDVNVFLLSHPMEGTVSKFEVLIKCDAIIALVPEQFPNVSLFQTICNPNFSQLIFQSLRNGSWIVFRSLLWPFAFPNQSLGQFVVCAEEGNS